jgi:hypothetical protein
MSSSDFVVIRKIVTEDGTVAEIIKHDKSAKAALCINRTHIVELYLPLVVQFKRTNQFIVIVKKSADSDSGLIVVINDSGHVVHILTPVTSVRTITNMAYSQSPTLGILAVVAEKSVYLWKIPDNDVSATYVDTITFKHAISHIAFVPRVNNVLMVGCSSGDWFMVERSVPSGEFVARCMPWTIPIGNPLSISCDYMFYGMGNGSIRTCPIEGSRRSYDDNMWIAEELQEKQCNLFDRFTYGVSFTVNAARLMKSL